MLFNSWQFLFLVAITFGIYYLPIFQQRQREILILASFLFYASFKPVLLFLLFSSITINATANRLIRVSTYPVAKTVAVLGVTLNLSILGFFKYAGLLSTSFLETESEVEVFLLSIPLPIGISFFTFQGISLLIDTLRKKKSKQPDHLKQKPTAEQHVNIALYLSFFPQLVAGPIVKARDFLPQIKTKNINALDWNKIFTTLVTGYFLKMVVADNLKDYTAWIEYPFFLTKSTLTLLAMLFGYSAQIFADFAGYSLIAIGTARLFGYQLNQNFNFPYIARSFSEFWTRWHISLSTFLKEYLYISLGGNRRSRARTFSNLLLVMILGGLWHGAAWSYAVWGAVHGLALVVERGISSLVTLPQNVFIKSFQAVLVFMFVTFAWLLFKLPDFDHVLSFGSALVQNGSVTEEPRLVVMILVYLLPVFLYHMYYLYSRQNSDNAFRTCEPYAYGCMVFLIVMNSGSAAEFVYFQF